MDRVANEDNFNNSLVRNNTPISSHTPTRPVIKDTPSFGAFSYQRPQSTSKTALADRKDYTTVKPRVTSFRSKEENLTLLSFVF